MGAAATGRPVVVGADGSRGALRAVEWAAIEAANRAAPLRIVTAFDPEPGAAPARDRALAEAVDVARRARPGLQVQSRPVAGAPVAVLDAESRAALLVAVGDRGSGGEVGSSPGSVAVALSTRARCPVVVVRGEAGSRDADLPVVVGVDPGSPSCDASLSFAFEAAAARGVAVVAVHTWWELLPGAAAAGDPDAIEDAERAFLDELLIRWRAAHPDVPVRQIVRRGLLAHALTERSRAAQLVVAGASGRGWPARQVLGSVSHTLMHRAACPVAVVRPMTCPAADRRDREDVSRPSPREAARQREPGDAGRSPLGGARVTGEGGGRPRDVREDMT